MDSDDVQFVGAPCGHHGPYTFYKAFKYADNGKMKILSLGDFFFMKILEDFPVCIGEIQLLWEEKGTNQLLASVRLYFQPQDTPDRDEDIYGEDEVLAVSEKLIVTAQDLCQLVVNDVDWNYGRSLYCYHDLPDNSLNGKGQADLSADLAQAFAANNRGLLFHDVDKEKVEMGVEKAEPHAPVVIMSYPQYCRYRAVLKRLENVTDIWLKNALVMAIGGFTSMHRGMRVMFCREVCDYPELDDLEFRVDHLAPNLKGRPRKKKLLSKKDSNQDSDSGGYGSDQSTNTTASGVSVSSKSKRIKNGLSPKTDNDEEKQFLLNLHKFMDKRNSPIDRLPSLGFKQIDLYLFYKAAQQLGGYDEITDKRLWKVLYDNLGGNPGNTSAATNTRRHYERLILPYEKHLKRLRVKPKGHLPVGKNLPPPSPTSDVQNGLNKNKTNRKPCVVSHDGADKETKDSKELSNSSTNTNLDGPVKEDKEFGDGKTQTGEEGARGQAENDRGHGALGRKVLNVEDLYNVQAVEIKAMAQHHQRMMGAAPLEVPLVRHRMTTSIMSPIMQRKLMGHHGHYPHSHHQSPTHMKPGDGGQSLLKAPSYLSTPPHSHHHHQHRNNHHSSGHHHSSHAYNSQPAHSNHSSRLSQSSLPSRLDHHQPSPAHSGTSRSSIPQHLKAPHDFSAQLRPDSANRLWSRDPTLPFQPPDVGALPVQPPPAHSGNSSKRPNPFSGSPSKLHNSFPHPDQVLSRIQTMHQTTYPPDTKRPKLTSPATSIPSSSSSSSSSAGSHDQPLDLSAKPARSSLSSSSSSRKDVGLSRAQERKQRTPTHSSSSSSSTGSSSLSSSKSQGASSSSTSALTQEQQEAAQQHSAVLLQSALFGAQFTALPRPAKPAHGSDSAAATNMLPLVHPAFMQAAFSPLSMYSPQLSPTATATALQLAAYEELVRQKALSSMAAVSSAPSYMMSSLPSAYSSQSSKESQQK